MCLDIPPLEGDDCNPLCLDSTLRGDVGGNDCCEFDPKFRACVNGYVATAVPFETCVSTKCGRWGDWCYGCSTSPPGAIVRPKLYQGVVDHFAHFPSAFKMEMFAQATER